MTTAEVAGADIAMSTIALAVQSLYGVAGRLDEFFESHIFSLTQSGNAAISRTGRVLEAAKSGFGLGYLTPVVIIATGQLLLGNPLAALKFAASAAVLSNPVATTCAAIGAIYFGWAALGDGERDAIVEQIVSGLSVGMELIRAIVRFVAQKASELFSEENLLEVREFVCNAAAMFGRSIGDITRTLADRAADVTTHVLSRAGHLAESVKATSVHAAESISDFAGDAAHAAQESSGRAAAVVRNALDEARLATIRRDRLGTKKTGKHV